jgi:hypothetical protein
LLSVDAIMSFQTIDFANPKDMSTSVFRVLRLRFYKKIVKNGEQLQSDREEPDLCFLCSTTNKKQKIRTYEWMSKAEMEVYPQWSLYQTSSIQKAQDLVADNKIYFLNLEATAKRSDLFEYGQAYVLPTHGSFVLSKFVFLGPKSVTHFMQTRKDETTVVSTYIPFEPQSKVIHWTQTPSRASKMDPMEYPYLAFIAEFCKSFSRAICAPSEQYNFHYEYEYNFIPVSPSNMCLTLLAAKEASPPASHPSELDMNESTKTTSTPIEEMVSSLEPQDPPASLVTEIEQKHASSYLSMEQTFYRDAERVVTMLCEEEMPNLDYDQDFPLDPKDVDLEGQYEEYERWWASCVENPALSQIPHSVAAASCGASSPAWAEQMHSEGLLVSSGTP